MNKRTKEDNNMRSTYTESFIGTVKAFSEAAGEFLLWAERHDAAQHPDTLASAWDLWISRFFRRNEGRTDNIGERFLLTQENMDIFTQNITVSEDRPAARRFNLIHIEPMAALGTMCTLAGLVEQAALADAVHDFALDLRRYGSRHPF